MPGEFAELIDRRRSSRAPCCLELGAQTLRCPVNAREFAIRERLREVEITDFWAEISTEARDLDRSCSLGCFVVAPDI